MVARSGPRVLCSVVAASTTPAATIEATTMESSSSTVPTVFNLKPFKYVMVLYVGSATRGGSGNAYVVFALHTLYVRNIILIGRTEKTVSHTSLWHWEKRKREKAAAVTGESLPLAKHKHKKHKKHKVHDCHFCNRPLCCKCLVESRSCYLF